MSTSDDRVLQSLIRLNRVSALRNRFGRYSVLIDKKKMGVISNGQQSEYSVDPGEHRVRLTVSHFWSRPEKLVSVRPRGVVDLVVKPGGKASALLDVFYPRSYISLEGAVPAPPAG